jgi:hypothetical protein
MIKIDWTNYIYDRVWFGYFRSSGDGDPNDEHYEPPAWCMSWDRSDRYIPMQTIERFFQRKGIPEWDWND